MTARAKIAKDFIASSSWKVLTTESWFRRGSISIGERLWSNSGGLRDTREPSRHAPRAGPDPEAERQYSARECVVQAVCGELGKPHLRQHCRAQFWLKDRRRLRGKICGGGAAGSMQGDGYPIAGERGD